MKVNFKYEAPNSRSEHLSEVYDIDFAEFPMMVDSDHLEYTKAAGFISTRSKLGFRKRFLMVFGMPRRQSPTILIAGIVAPAKGMLHRSCHLPSIYPWTLD